MNQGRVQRGSRSIQVQSRMILGAPSHVQDGSRRIQAQVQCGSRRIQVQHRSRRIQAQVQDGSKRIVGEPRPVQAESASPRRIPGCLEEFVCWLCPELLRAGSCLALCPSQAMPVCAQVDPSSPCPGERHRAGAALGGRQHPPASPGHVLTGHGLGLLPGHARYAHLGGQLRAEAWLLSQKLHLLPNSCCCATSFCPPFCCRWLSL